MHYMRDRPGHGRRRGIEFLVSSLRNRIAVGHMHLRRSSRWRAVESMLIERNRSLHSPTTGTRDEIVRCVVSMDSRCIYRNITRTSGRHRRVVLIVGCSECSWIVQPVDDIHRGRILLMALMMVSRMPVHILWFISGCLDLIAVRRIPG